MPKMSKIVRSILNIKHHEYVDDIQKADEHMQKRSLDEDEHYENTKRIPHKS